jgi:hypothetical protein
LVLEKRCELPWTETQNHCHEVKSNGSSQSSLIVDACGLAFLEVTLVFPTIGLANKSLEWDAAKSAAPLSSRRSASKEKLVNLIKPIAFAAALFAASPLAIAASQADIDKLTTYAVVLGRAVACGANLDDASRRVGRWMDRTFPPGSKD